MQDSYSFGEFELHPARFELRRQGRLVRLERIPMELLILLAERNGDLVARPEIAARLWSKDVFVDTEHGINTAIRKIRTAINEEADRPRYLFTVPGKGYRLATDVRSAVAAPEPVGNAATDEPPSIVAASPPGASRVPRNVSAWLGLAAIFAIGIGLVGLNWPRGRVTALSTAAPVRSLAVLPVANLTGDESQEYLADGITDELITMLAKRTPVRILSRTTVMQYKGAKKPLPDIGRELNVDAIVEGSISRTGGRAHVSIQLVRAANDAQVWADSYDRDPDALYELSAEVSDVIARRIGAASTGATAARRIAPSAHDAYLRGRYFWFSHRWDQALDEMQKAVAIQPDYAAAWSGLADAYAVKAVVQVVPPKAVAAQAQAASRRALELDDSLAEAHGTAAAIALFQSWDFKQADRESQRAIELNPDIGELHHLRGYVLLAVNRLDEALREQTRASELDPFERPGGVGTVLIHRRQYDAAIRELRFRKDARPQDGAVRDRLADAYLYSGRASDYVNEIMNAAADKESRAAIAAAFAHKGLKGVAALQLDGIRRVAEHRYVSPLALAHYYARAGQPNETLSQLEAAVTERIPFLIFLQTEPDFDFVHDTDRYRAIVKRIGLPIDH
jgi:TolB-like protein/DNA-binding winged helix-turn-helix (wHTH) protein